MFRNTANRNYFAIAYLRRHPYLGGRKLCITFSSRKSESESKLPRRILPI
ncbi:hypothetical protein RhiirA1_470926 [Rhizophagus irregularis]|uniref:Uncharacterized protein n=1 Tax=Rhizophagus irregularis TaxID=588596 RepID=A0A2N0R5A2_9GLOM|nr:hypothetical protein RhiirA1_470926 [Rhizophagus irregularis]